MQVEEGTARRESAPGRGGKHSLSVEQGVDLGPLDHRKVAMTQNTVRVRKKSASDNLQLEYLIARDKIFQISKL